MAATKKPDTAKNSSDDKKNARKGSGKLTFYTLATLIILASPFIFPTIILVLLGLIPTIIELFIDHENEHSSTAAVGAMNFAGIVPFILDLWTRGQKLSDALAILETPSTWLFMLGGAAVGKLIVFAIPQAMASLTLARYEARLKLLQQHQEQLKSNWGADVATVKPIDKIVGMN